MTPDDSDTIRYRTESDHYGPNTPCSQCGAEIDEDSPEWAEYCHRHQTERINPLKQELRALIQEWREEARIRLHPGEEEVIMDRADELEQLIENDE